MTIAPGRVSGDPSGYLLEFDEVYATDIDDLWSAVTEPDRLARWMTTYRGDLRLGGEWEALAGDGSVWGRGRVTACDPPRSFETVWQAEEEPPTTLHVELHPVDGGTRLSLRHDGVRSIYHGAGWHVYLESLAASVADAAYRVTEPGWDARFAEVSDDYTAKFGALRS